MQVSIWSRRILQGMLARNAEAFGRDGALKQAHLLNAWDEDTISVQWEIAILFGLSFLGNIVHEAPTPSGTRLDVTFGSFGGCVAFAADIVTVTDAGLNERNPLHRFEAELDRRTRKAGLTTDGFDIRVGGRSEKRTRGTKTHLTLPPIAEFDAIFDATFAAFLRRVRETPASPASFAKRTEVVDVEITYTPSERSTTTRYAGYAWPQSLTMNPLYHALDRKAKQLKRADAGLPSVILACDGASESLRTRQSPIPGVYSPPQIIERFFRDPSVTAVCVIKVVRGRSLGREELKVDLKVFTHPSVSSGDATALSHLLLQLPDLIPKPRYDVPNAVIRVADRKNP